MNIDGRMAKDMTEIFLIRSSRNSFDFKLFFNGNLVRLECSCEKECVNRGVCLSGLSQSLCAHNQRFYF